MFRYLTLGNIIGLLILFMTVIEKLYRLQSPRPRCIKLAINGNFAFTGNYHGNKTL